MEQQYITTKEECEKNILGVCEGCGGALTAIETVDNSGRPTFWQGCEHCSCFRSGVDSKYFKVARKLVEEGMMLPYSHMRRLEYENTPERLQYFLDSQTAGLSHNIAFIHRLIAVELEETKMADGAPAGASDSTQLLCCPFCGGKAVARFTNMIYCENTVDCGAQVESGDSGELTFKFTIAAWNRRSNTELTGAPSLRIRVE